MEESLGSRYALQIALQTLKERCQQFQLRIVSLEEENINLRLKCGTGDSSNENSLNEIDRLMHHVAELTEQKQQLSKNVSMVTTENRKLWTRLSKLTQRNETIGSKLNRINDSLSQHNSSAPALIRSKTFTQESPQNKFYQRDNKDISEQSDKISLELEDISLKLISSIAQGKSELEHQCSEMAEIQANEEFLVNSFTFGYISEDSDNAAADDMELHLSELRDIKTLLAKENKKLLKEISNLATAKGPSPKQIQNTAKETSSKMIQTEQTTESSPEEARDLEELMKWATPNSSGTFNNNPAMPLKMSDKDDSQRICPICNKRCTITFEEFQVHVENHFTGEDDDATPKV